MLESFITGILVLGGAASCTCWLLLIIGRIPDTTFAAAILNSTLILPQYRRVFKVAEISALTCIVLFFILN